MDQSVVDQLLAHIEGGECLVATIDQGRLLITVGRGNEEPSRPAIRVGADEIGAVLALHPDKVVRRRFVIGPNNEAVAKDEPFRIVQPPPARPLIDYPLYPIEPRPRCFASQVLIEHLSQNNPSGMSRYSVLAFRDKHGEHLVSPRIATRLPEFVIKWMIRKDLRGDMWLERDGHIYVRTQWLLSRFGKDHSLRHALASLGHEAI